MVERQVVERPATINARALNAPKRSVSSIARDLTSRSILLLSDGEDASLLTSSGSSKRKFTGSCDGDAGSAVLRQVISKEDMKTKKVN
jgi:hypothetical protein